jgi:hypothetical protein
MVMKGVRMMEVEFPISPDKIDVSLGGLGLADYASGYAFAFSYLVSVEP